MRRFMVFGVGLLVTSSAMAYTQVDLVARGIGWEVDTAIHGTDIILDVIITSDELMTAASFGFDAPAGVTYAPFVMEYDTWVLNYADDLGMPPINTAGWSVLRSEAVALPGGELDSITADLAHFELSSIFDDGNDLPTGGFFAWLEVTLIETDEPYTIGIDARIANVDFTAIEGIVCNGLTVVPEPAGALLLLLGVPFLRRR